MRHARGDDRVALVVNSMLLKLQMKRMLLTAPNPIFLDEVAAIEWLTGERDASAMMVGALRPV